MQGIDELERVVKTLDAPEMPEEAAPDPVPAEAEVEAPADAAPEPVEEGLPGQKKGLFSRLFGRPGR